MDDGPTIPAPSAPETFDLERVRVAALMRMPAVLLNAPAVELREYETMVAAELAIQLNGFIWQQDLGRQFRIAPENWWEAVKDRWAPEWFLRRWPVRWTVFEINVKAIYPKLALPTEDRVLQVEINSRRQ